MGRPPHKISDATRRKAEELSGMGLPAKFIAAALDISEPTLTKYYEAELRRGKAQCGEKVTRTAFDMAVSGREPAMTMFWLKTQLGWREVSRTEVTGADGGPVELRAGKLQIDPSRLTDGELDTFIELGKKIQYSGDQIDQIDQIEEIDANQE